jgi:hypothetical protein
MHDLASFCTQNININSVRNGTSSKHHHFLSKSQGRTQKDEDEWNKYNDMWGGRDVDEVTGCHRAQCEISRIEHICAGYRHPLDIPKAPGRITVI